MSNISESTQNILHKAQVLATQNKHVNFDVIHFLAVLPTEATELFNLIKKAGIAEFRFDKLVKNSLSSQASSAANVPQEPSLGRALSFAITHAQSQKTNDSLNEYDIFTSIYKTQPNILSLLKEAGFDTEQFENSQNHPEQNQEEEIPPYFVNYSLKAKNGSLDPVIGREELIERVMQILSRRTKNNPILIGEPGVGKTAIVEGLAQAIEQKMCPEPLWTKTVLGLDLTSLIAGAKYRGEFEERLKKVMDYLEKHQDQYLIFIDEIHMLVGAGKTDGAMDAANILKPALARGSLHCIGATTLDEYRTGIEKDPALERRFQKVFVQEPSNEQTLSILRGIKERYEQHHNIKIADSALCAAVELSTRYINDRYLPDKAIDLIDEAASKRKLDLVSKPIELREIETQLHHLNMELVALKEQPDLNSEKLNKVQQQVQQLNAQQKELSNIWNEQKKNTQNISELVNQLNQLKLQQEQALRSANYELASQLQYSKIPELQKQLKNLENVKTESTIVDENDIIACIAKATGIPVDKIKTAKHQTLAKLENILKQSVQGQDHVVNNVANAIRRSHFGISDPNKPLASFLFVGPTGVGKTFLAKSLAQTLFDSNKNLLRFDMSEFMEKHSVSKLIGAPPGYIGYENAGLLTEAVRQRPYQVILFDEIEKAHPEVLNILLQLLDDGILTDSHGKTVNFKNCIIIMTTNLCANVILENKQKPYFLIEQLVQAHLQEHLKPEFFNRIDAIETFTPLDNSTIVNIINDQFKILQDRLLAQKITLTFDSEVAQFIESSVTESHLGARPVKRAIQNLIENPLANALAKGAVNSQQPIHVYLNIGKVQFSNLT